MTPYHIICILLVALGMVLFCAFYYRRRYRKNAAAMHRAFSREIQACRGGTCDKNLGYEILLNRLTAENGELKRLNEIKSKFMSMVAHDLKQPLTSVQGYASNLSDYEDNPVRRKMLDTISKAAQNMTYLINDLVDASALASGRFSLHMKKFIYNDLVEDIYQQYKMMADRKQINFRIIEMPVKIEVTADKLRIHQVISNMLTNAFKFTQPGGTIEIKYFTDSGFLCTSVRDSGSGIMNIDRVKVFERFTQSEFMPDEYRRLGLGLGMSIAYDIVQAHKGMIENDSAGLGHGSMFWFSIPLTQPDAEVEEE